MKKIKDKSLVEILAIIIILIIDLIIILNTIGVIR
jgi:hypothetical protein